MRSILVTGASRGLGRKLVEAFGARQWRVFGLVRRESDARDLATQLPRDFHPIVSDVASDAVTSTIREALHAHANQLDVLVNNAGIPGQATRLDEVTCDEMSRLLEVHCLGALRCTQACMPFLSASPQPLVVNITSRLGSAARNASGEFTGRPFSYAYRIAKGAQNMLTLCLSQECTDGKLTVCAIHPGKLKTDSAPHDADTEPQHAAERLATWIESADSSANGRCLDLFEGEMGW